MLSKLAVIQHHFPTMAHASLSLTFNRFCTIGLSTSAGDLQVVTGHLPKNTRRLSTHSSGSPLSHGSDRIQVWILKFAIPAGLTCVYLYYKIELSVQLLAKRAQMTTCPQM